VGYSASRTRLLVRTRQLCAVLELDGTIQRWRLEHPEALEPGSQWRETASVGIHRPLTRSEKNWGNWATSLIWGRVHKIATDTTLNSYLLESTLKLPPAQLRFLEVRISRQR